MTENVLNVAQLADQFASIVGPGYVRVGSDIEERYKSDVMGFYASTPEILVRPGSTQEVSALMRILYEKSIPVSVIGGNSGCVGGTVSENGVAMALDRMNRVEDIDCASMTMQVEAGTLLQTVQEAAAAENAMFAVDLAARGSATIGGMIATNAGGNRVIRFGMMRESVLGIEVVLADGRVVTGLRTMLKDNAGYDWKQLLIGSEGTLGIVTRAVLRLRPASSDVRTALLALPDVKAATQILRRLEAKTVGSLVSFELMWGDFYEKAIAIRDTSNPPPLPTGYPLYAIVETLADEDDGGEDRFFILLGQLLEENLSQDIVIAKSERERASIWAMRENVGEAMESKGKFIGFDVSVNLARLSDFVDAIRAALAAEVPTAEAYFYGHAGDGNAHIAITGCNGDEVMAREIEDQVYGVVGKFGGSISAEHGVGLHKSPFLHHSRSPEEIDLMMLIKRTMDPRNILNPGKIFM